MGVTILRDRGIKKWVSLMLPEHVQSLKELEMDDYKIDKPILDQQQYEELNGLILEAITTHTPLTFSYYSNEVIEILTGRIDFLDEIKREIHMIDTELKKKVLKLENIIRIKD